MSDMATKFNVKLSVICEVTKVAEDGTESPFSTLNSSIDYRGMDYLQITATQQAIVDFGQSLTNLGWAAAGLMGFDVSTKKSKE